MRSARDFRRIYRRGRRVHGSQLVVVGLENRLSHHRLGLAVSKEHGRAVRRNKIKRLIREAFRLTRPELPGHFDLVVIPRPDPEARYDLTRLRLELLELVRDLERRRDPPDRPRRRRGSKRRGGRRPRSEGGR